MLVVLVLNILNKNDLLHIESHYFVSLRRLNCSDDYVPSLFKVKCYLLCHDYYSNWRHVAVARITACSVMHPAVGI